MASYAPIRPLIVVGTRPEAIKLAPLILACHNHSSIRPLVCSTGQSGPPRQLAGCDTIGKCHLIRRSDR